MILGSTYCSSVRVVGRACCGDVPHRSAPVPNATTLTMQMLTGRQTWAQLLSYHAGHVPFTSSESASYWRIDLLSSWPMHTVAGRLILSSLTATSEMADRSRYKHRLPRLAVALLDKALCIGNSAGLCCSVMCRSPTHIARVRITQYRFRALLQEQ